MFIVLKTSPLSPSPCPMDPVENGEGEQGGEVQRVLEKIIIF